LLQAWSELATLTESLPFDVNLWKSQNVFYELLRTVYPAVQERAGDDDDDTQRWSEEFTALTDQLSVIDACQAHPHRHLPPPDQRRLHAGGCPSDRAVPGASRHQ